MDATKVASVTEWESPENVGDIRSFLGLAGYCNTQVFKAWMPVMPSSTILGIVLLWDITEFKVVHSLTK